MQSIIILPPFPNETIVIQRKRHLKNSRPKGLFQGAIHAEMVIINREERDVVLQVFQKIKQHIRRPIPPKTLILPIDRNH